MSCSLLTLPRLGVRRAFLVFVHTASSEVPQIGMRAEWVPLQRPTLAAMHSYFPVLPPGLLRPCRIPPEVLEVYLDPWYLPPGRAHDPTTVENFRFCSPAQQARTFMAAYHQQHTLPHNLLERGGLLCSLLKTSESVRFFAAPEIASCHGAQEVHLLLSNDQASMRIHGNALAVQQGCLVLANALQFLDRPGPPDPLQVLANCQAQRLTARTSALFRVPGGWIFAHLRAVGRALGRKSLRQQIEYRLNSAACRFHELPH